MLKALYLYFCCSVTIYQIFSLTFLLLLRDVISLVSFQILPFLSLIKAIYLFMGGLKKRKSLTGLCIPFRIFSVF